MKKNLLILALVVAVVAVATRFNRESGENAGWAALRQDETRCLEALWGKAPQVQMAHAKAGLVLDVTQPFAPDILPARRSWSYEVARLVAARHPKVPLAQIRVLDATNGQEVALVTSEERTELLRRQRQARADQILPGTLVLLEIVEAPAPSARLELNQSIPGARARAPHHGENFGAPKEVEAMDSAPPPPKAQPVTTTCWLVTPKEPPQALLDALNPLDRVVRLPQP